MCLQLVPLQRLIHAFLTLPAPATTTLSALRHSVDSMQNGRREQSRSLATCNLMVGCMFVMTLNIVWFIPAYIYIHDNLHALFSRTPFSVFLFYFSCILLTVQSGQLIQFFTHELYQTFQVRYWRRPFLFNHTNWIFLRLPFSSCTWSIWSRDTSFPAI